ncbi:MAG: hypothetical protein MZU91_12620 [Desulfosudis oleivorans]|nr:hypothetical protein [Desulfosudis oleivorans]
MGGDPGRRLRGPGADRAARSSAVTIGDDRDPADEVRPARLRVRRRGAVGGGAAVPGPDDQFPHARRRLCTGVQLGRPVGSHAAPRARRACIVRVPARRGRRRARCRARAVRGARPPRGHRTDARRPDPATGGLVCAPAGRRTADGGQ